MKINGRSIKIPQLLFRMFLIKVGRIWYSYLSKLDKNAEVIFLNHGYAEDKKKLELKKEDENNRYCIQLYNHIVSSAPIKMEGLDILEVSCGRGGGASYIHRYFNPNSMTGIDLCKNAIRFCKKHYSIKGMSFFRRDALNLLFKDNSFDIVINIEASHNYTDMDKFFSEVNRVLKQGGYFLYTDFRSKKLVNLLKEQLNASNLKIIKEEIITSNIVKALNLDSERRLGLIKKLTLKFLHKLAKEFAGVKGTGVYKSFMTGRKEYLNFVLQKR